jgi:hypothetical protein
MAGDRKVVQFKLVLADRVVMVVDPPFKVMEQVEVVLEDILEMAVMDMVVIDLPAAIRV